MKLENAHKMLLCAYVCVSEVSEMLCDLCMVKNTRLLGWPKKFFSFYAFIRTQHFDLPTGKPYVHKFEENQAIFRGCTMHLKIAQPY